MSNKWFFNASWYALNEMHRYSGYLWGIYRIIKQSPHRCFFENKWGLFSALWRLGFEALYLNDMSRISPFAWGSPMIAHMPWLCLLLASFRLFYIEARVIALKLFPAHSRLTISPREMMPSEWALTSTVCKTSLIMVRHVAGIPEIPSPAGQSLHSRQYRRYWWNVVSPFSWSAW